MKNMPAIASKLLPLGALLLLLSVWELAVRILALAPWLLPAPSQVASAMANAFPTILRHSAATIWEALAGLAVSVLLAFLLAILMDWSELLEKTLYPLFVISQTIPLIILAVLFTIWFGWGLTPKVLIVVLVCFFPLVINLRQGMQAVDGDLIDLLRSMGARKGQILSLVKLPSALPAFFAGLRIAASYSVMTAVIAELMGAESGLGYYIMLTQKSFQIDRVLAAVAWICFLSLALVKTVDVLETGLLPWKNLHLE